MATACVCSDYFTVSDTGELCLKPGTMGLRDTFYFTTPGTYQFIKDDYPWLARVRVQVQGAGGGSAGADAAASECIARPGGAGGGYAVELISASGLGAVETIVVGAGGTAGGTTTDAGNGGNSSFGGYVIANGGSGGTANMPSGVGVDTSQGIAGPLAGSGDDASGGGASGSAIRLSGIRGIAGNGGDSRMGHGGLGRTTEGPGTAPRGHGAGAGGALSFGNAVAGADGGDGAVIIELYG